MPVPMVKKENFAMLPRIRRAAYVISSGAEQGLGLIEVLVSLLVFSIGILGVASTQLDAKRASHEATQRTLATSLGRDIIERMRSNPQALSSYAVTELGGSIVDKGTDCSVSSCSPTLLAKRDLYEWNELLQGASQRFTAQGSTSYAGGLADARACIAVASGKISVALAWRGFSSMQNPSGSNCGQGTGLYGPSHEKRRLLLLSTYVAY